MEAPSPSEPVAEDDASLDSDVFYDFDASDAFDAFIDSDDEHEYGMDFLQQPLPSGDAVSSPPPALDPASQSPFPRPSHRYGGTFTAAESEDQSTACGMAATKDGWNLLYAQLLLNKMYPDALAKISMSSSCMAKKHGTAAQVDVGCRHG